MALMTEKAKGIPKVIKMVILPVKPMHLMNSMIRDMIPDMRPVTLKDTLMANMKARGTVTKAVWRKAYMQVMLTVITKVIKTGTMTVPPVSRIQSDGR